MNTIKWFQVIKTMESYRRVWENFFNYLLEHWKIKDFEKKIEAQHIEAYMIIRLNIILQNNILKNFSCTW